MISGWAIANIILGILIMITAMWSIVYFWDYILIYRTPKIFLAIVLPPIIVGWVWLWVIVYYETIGYPPLEWPGFIPIVEVISFILLLVYYSLLLGFFGGGIRLRAKYRTFKEWGPYCTFGESSIAGETTMNITFLSSKISNSKNLNLMKISPLPKNISIEPHQPCEESKNPIRDLHSYKIAGLLPDQKYCIQLMDFLPAIQLWTPPSCCSNVLGSATEFIVIGDIHAGEKDLTPLVNQILRFQNAAKFVLTLGDIVQESQNMSYWRTFFGQMNPLLSCFPFIYIPGNHDGYTRARKDPWRQLIRQPYVNPRDGCYFSLDYGNIHFVLLDNYNLFGDFGKLSKNQLVWLDQDLLNAEESPDIHHIILCLHKPPYSTGDVGVDHWLSAQINARIQRNRKIKLVLSGHCHFYQHFLQKIDVRENERDIHFIITGGGGGRLEESVLKKIRFYRRPYYWTSKGEVQQPAFIPYRKFVKNNQNNAFIKANHQKSRIFRHFLHVKVTTEGFTIQVIGWDGICFEEIKIK